VKAALNNYEEDYNLDPIEFSALDENQESGGDAGDADNSGGDYEDNREVFAYAMSPSQLTNGIHMNGHHNGVVDEDSSDEAPMHIVTDAAEDAPVAPPSAKRLRSDSNISSSHTAQFQNFDSSSSALLIDRMFAHLAKETEVMREWVHLERERLSQEVSRRREEHDREERREKVFLSTITKMQEQMFTYLAKHPQGNESPSSSNASHHHHRGGLEEPLVEDA